MLKSVDVRNFLSEKWMKRREKKKEEDKREKEGRREERRAKEKTRRKTFLHAPSFAGGVNDISFLDYP